MAEVSVNKDFVGLNKDRPDTNLGLSDASEATNVIFSDQSVQKRHGSTRLTPYLAPKSSMEFGYQQYAQTPEIKSSWYNDLGYKHLTDWTMEVSCRFNSGVTSNTYCIAERGYGDSAEVNGWVLGFHPNTKEFRYKEKLNTGSDIDLTGTWTNYSPLKPFHLAVRRSGTKVWMWLEDNEFSGKIGEQTGLTAGAVETQTTNVFPLLFSTGFNDIVAGWGSMNLNGRIQEFRTWDYARSTDSIQEWALKELAPHATATDSLKFYYKFTEGKGDTIYDYGYIQRTGLSTMTNAFAAQRMPSQPEWVDGLVTGGLGDRAVRLDGREDFVALFNHDDALAVFRTGTSEWTVQAICKPLDGVADDSVVLMYGDATHTPGSNGFAFRVKMNIDWASNTRQFKADFGFNTETKSITWGTSFTYSNRYALTLQKTTDEVRFKVEDLTDGITGSFETASHVSAGSPDFGAGIQLLMGAQYPLAGTTLLPTTGFAHMELDEVRLFSGIFDYPMNVQYVGGNDPTLIGYYRFNDGSGNVAADASLNRNNAVLIPYSSPPSWTAGWVEPVEGPEILGIFYYQKNYDQTSIPDARERSLLIHAGNTLYRNEGDRWNELQSGRDGEELNTGAQLDRFLAISNGRDENIVYDGSNVWNNGLESPSDAGTASVYAISGQSWDTMSNQGVWLHRVLSENGFVCVDAARTEQGYSFNDKRFFHSTDIGTITTRCEQYFKDRVFKNVFVSVYKTNSYGFTIWHKDLNTGSWNIKLYGLEGAFLGIWTGPLTGTQTVRIETDHKIDPKNGSREITTFDSVTGNPGVYTTGHYSTLELKGHFIWKTAATHTIYDTSSYEVSLADGGVSGYFYYRHTNYNRFTGVESNPSPPTDDRVGPDDQVVLYTVSTITDTNVTDRLVYRTKTNGGRMSGDYFLLGTATGTGQIDFADLTPAGDEGRLISFYRGKPPKASICISFKSRMWYNSVEEPNLLYFSDVNRPSEVDPYNYLIFGDENDPITGIGYQYDYLVVFKRRSTWLLSRADIPAGMRPYCISRSIGCVSHHSIVEVTGELLFLSERGIYALRGSQLSKVSSGKVQYFIDRLDPDRLSRAVGVHLADDGIYRLNFSPLSAYATTVRSGVNSWYLDYHYQRSLDHVPFPERIWSYGEREVSFYGRYVAENGMFYPVYGDYRGAVALDNMPDNYTDGVGWYRGSAVWDTVGAVGDVVLSAGVYTLTVSNGSLNTYGHGLKGLPVHLRSSTATESAICYANTAGQIVLQSPTQNDYQQGDHVFVAPICSRYKSGWMDFGSTARDKKMTYLKVDHRVLDNTSTMTVGLYAGRPGSVNTRGYQTHTIALNGVNRKLEVRTFGKHLQIEFQHDWPGERFEIFSWEFLLNPGGAR